VTKPADPVQTAHMAAVLAAACGDGTIGGALTRTEREDIYWRVLARELAAKLAVCPTCRTAAALVVEGHPCRCCWGCVGAARRLAPDSETRPGTRECEACA